MSRLIWCRYLKSSGESTTKMYVEIGAGKGVIYVLDNSLLGNEEITLIRQAARYLPKMTVEDRVAWIKSTIPGAIKAIRSLKVERMVVLNSFPIKSI